MQIYNLYEILYINYFTIQKVINYLQKIIFLIILIFRYQIEYLNLQYGIQLIFFRKKLLHKSFYERNMQIMYKIYKNKNK